MVKKTLLSLAIAASTAGLTACNISSTADSNEVETSPILAGQPGQVANSAAVVFSAARGQVPVATDFLFAAAPTTDGTASTTDTTPPVTTAINSLEGFSTVAAHHINFNTALDSASVIAGQTVFLIKLKNGSEAEAGGAIDALNLASIVNPANSGTSPFSPNQPVDGEGSALYEANYVALDDGATHTIQISPTAPLDAKSKYIVVLTDGLKSSGGEDIAQSSEYKLVSSGDELFTASLAPVRTAVQAWETLAGLFLNGATQGAITQDNIILSYAFTTGGTTEVLTNIAAPQLFVEALASQPTTAESLYLAAIKGGAMQGGATEEEAEVIAFTDLITNIVMPIVDADDSLTIADPASPTTAELDAVRANATYQGTIVGAASSSGVVNGITATLATPGPQNFEVIKSGATTAYKLSTIGITTPVESGELGIGFVQGQIELPVGLSAPAMTNPAALASGDAATIAGAVKLSYATDSVWAAEDQFKPPSDNMKFNPATGKLTSVGVTEVKDDEGNITGYTGGMTNVTYRYPLAEFDQTEFAPVLMTVPSKVDYTAAGGDDCSAVDKFKTIIYVHGITSNRTSSIGMGTAMALNCYVTVAMDLPLHGVAPIANDRNGVPADNELRGFNVENGSFGFATAAQAATPTFNNMEERHRNIASQAGTNARVAMDFDGTVNANGTDGTPALGNSGSFYINLGNMGRNRDNTRQAVVDLMHLNATIGAIDVDGDGTPDLDVDNIYLAGNSLGAIVATTFAAVNNQAAVQAKNTNLPLIQAVVLASPGASLPKMLENSPAFATTILGGLQLAQDAENLQKYESILQAALNSVDPINFASLLRSDTTPILMYNMVGGGDCPAFDSATGTCGDGDSGDKIPAAIVQAFNGVYPPDHVVPNDDYFKSAETNPYVNVMPGLTYKLNGTVTALQNLDSSAMALAGTIPLAEQMGLTQVSTTNIASATFNKKAYVPFEKGSHVTFVAKDDNATFTTMMKQMGYFFATAGAALNPAEIDGIAAEQTGYVPVAGE
jgi:pimeloyl-ACP methyl ester carboxylesterase